MSQLTKSALLGALTSQYKNTKPFLQEVESDNTAVCPVISEALLEIFRSNTCPLAAKMHAMKFFKEMFETAEWNVIDEIDEGVEMHIKEVAKYKKQMKEMTRGTSYFIEKEKRPDTKEARTAGSSYVLFALQMIANFAKWYPKEPDGQETRFSEYYKELKELGVHFPDAPVYFKPQDRERFIKNTKKWETGRPSDNSEPQQQKQQPAQNKNVNQTINKTTTTDTKVPEDSKNQSLDTTIKQPPTGQTSAESKTQQPPAAPVPAEQKKPVAQTTSNLKPPAVTASRLAEDRKVETKKQKQREGQSQKLKPQQPNPLNDQTVSEINFSKDPGTQIIRKSLPIDEKKKSDDTNFKMLDELPENSVIHPGDPKGAKESIQKLNQEIQRLKSEINKSQSETKELLTRNNKKQSQISELEAERDRLNKELQAIKDIHNSEVTQLKKRMSDIVSQNSSLKKTVSETQASQNDKSVAVFDKIKEQRRQLQAKYDALLSSTKEKDTMIKTQQEQLGKLKEQIQRYIQNQSLLKDKIKKLSAREKTETAGPVPEEPGARSSRSPKVSQANYELQEKHLNLIHKLTAELQKSKAEANSLRNQVKILTAQQIQNHPPVDHYLEQNDRAELEVCGTTYLGLEQAPQPTDRKFRELLKPEERNKHNNSAGKISHTVFIPQPSKAKHSIPRTEKTSFSGFNTSPEKYLGATTGFDAVSSFLESAGKTDVVKYTDRKHNQVHKIPHTVNLFNTIVNQRDPRKNPHLNPQQKYQDYLRKSFEVQNSEILNFDRELFLPLNSSMRKFRECMINSRGKFYQDQYLEISLTTSPPTEEESTQQQFCVTFKNISGHKPVACQYSIPPNTSFKCVKIEFKKKFILQPNMNPVAEVFLLNPMTFSIPYILTVLTLANSQSKRNIYIPISILSFCRFEKADKDYTAIKMKTVGIKTEEIQTDPKALRLTFSNFWKQLQLTNNVNSMQSSSSSFNSSKECHCRVVYVNDQRYCLILKVTSRDNKAHFSALCENEKIRPFAESLLQCLMFVFSEP